MDKNLFGYIWKHTRRQQLWILLIILLSMPPYFMSFDIPKQIVNGPIQGKGFDAEGATGTFLRIALDMPGGEVVLFPGIALERMPMLFALSFLFLALVVVNGLFKFYINTYKGRLGERMLRRIRYELIDRVLRFPPFQFRRVKSSEVATMVKDEVEPLGGFIGDAFTQPAFLGGQAITALVFILVQNLMLGMVAAGIVAIQALIIPRLRRKLIALGRERQLTARALAGRVGEIVDTISAVHVHDTSNYERTEIAERLAKIFKIRYDLYQWKFFVKFLNNFLAQVTPFFFYIIGGYLALRGSLDIGQLVAVIAAYKDLPSPIKDLIDWDQTRLDVQVKYAQVVEQFSVDRMADPAVQALTREVPPPIAGPIAVSGLAVSDDSGAKLLERVSLTIPPGEKLAVVGTPGGGAETFAEALARLHWPQAGRIAIGGRDIAELPEAVTGRRMTYAAPDTPLQQASVRDVLLYALKHAPLVDAPEAGGNRAWEIKEARSSGNPEFDLEADWIDYAAAGAAGPGDIGTVIARVLAAVDLATDIFDMGLRSAVDPATEPELSRRVVALRATLQARLGEANLSDTVVPFDPEAYNDEATVADNLLFGAPVGAALAGPALAANAHFRGVLARHGLNEPLFAMGLEIAGTVIDLFRDLPPNHPLFEQLTFMRAEELPNYQAAVQRLQGKSYEAAGPDDRGRMLALSLLYVEPRYRFGLIDEELRARLVEARKSFRETLPRSLAGAVEFYDPAGYTESASLLDNILFGRIAQRSADGERATKAAVRKLLDDEGLTDAVLGIGLGFNVGVAGKRLTMGQRQKLHMARALIKRPDIAIFNKPLNALDARAQEQIIDAALKWLGGASVVWVLSNPAQARKFGRIVVFDRGLVVEDGTHEALAARGGTYAGLVS